MSRHEKSISEDTQKMLHTLEERKEKMDTLKKRQRRLFSFSSLLITAFIVYFYLTTLSSSVKNPLDILSNLTGNAMNVLLLLTAITLYTYSVSYARKAEKAKRKFEDLRIEVIERLDSTWMKTQHSDVRDEISRDMERKGINVSYKSK